MIDKFQIQSHLDEFPLRLSDIQGALIATLDGITVVKSTTDERSSQLAAMTAAALGLGKRLIETANGGNLEEISFKGETGSVFIYALEKKAVLVVVTKRNPNVALVNWESKKLIEIIGASFV